MRPSAAQPHLLVGEARRQAQEWVEREARTRDGFVGAFLTGSTKWKPAEAPHTPSSDVDVRVVVDREERSGTWGKSRYRDILLETAAVTREQMGPVEAILANPHVAGSLWHPVLLADPTGELAELGRRVTAEFPRRHWVEARVRGAGELVRLYLRSIDGAPSFPEQVTCWLFGTSATTLLLLAAALRNLTVRRRYAESRALLEEHGRPGLHEEMLAWLGCADWTREDVLRQLETLATVFDATTPHVDPAFRFAADLQPEARPIAIDGARELVDAALHREAVYWIVATFSRCLQSLRTDAPAPVRARGEAGLRGVLDALGIASRADLRARADRVRAALPRLEDVARDVREATPAAVD